MAILEEGEDREMNLSRLLREGAGVVKEEGRKRWELRLRPSVREAFTRHVKTGGSQIYESVEAALLEYVENHPHEMQVTNVTYVEAPVKHVSRKTQYKIRKLMDEISVEMTVLQSLTDPNRGGNIPVLLKKRWIFIEEVDERIKPRDQTPELQKAIDDLVELCIQVEEELNEREKRLQEEEALREQRKNDGEESKRVHTREVRKKLVTGMEKAIYVKMGQRPEPWFTFEEVASIPYVQRAEGDVEEALKSLTMKGVLLYAEDEKTWMVAPLPMDAALVETQALLKETG